MSVEFVLITSGKTVISMFCMSHLPLSHSMGELILLSTSRVTTGRFIAISIFFSPLCNHWIKYKHTIHFSLGFLNVDSIDVLSLIILCGVGCPAPCRIFTNMPNLYSLDSRSIYPSHPSCNKQKYVQILLDILMGAKFPSVENH